MAFLVSPMAYASDWKEYGILCEAATIEGKIEALVFTTQNDEHDMDHDAEDSSAFVKAVNQLIQHGWQPLGGLEFELVEIGLAIVECQTMVKK